LRTKHFLGKGMPGRSGDGVPIFHEKPALSMTTVAALALQRRFGARRAGAGASLSALTACETSQGLLNKDQR
jgi:hypothetical protein